MGNYSFDELQITFIINTIMKNIRISNNMKVIGVLVGMVILLIIIKLLFF
jgi:hypothetical protein